MCNGSRICICFDLISARGLVNRRKLGTIGVAFQIFVALGRLRLAFKFDCIILVLYRHLWGSCHFYYCLVCLDLLVSSLYIGIKGHLFGFDHIGGSSWAIIPCNAVPLMYPFS